MAVMITNW